LNPSTNWLSSAPLIDTNYRDCPDRRRERRRHRWSKDDQALGKPGTNQPGGVHKYGLPRWDLKINVDGVAIKPTFALGSWIGYMPMGNDAMFMGDLILTDNESRDETADR